MGARRRPQDGEKRGWYNGHHGPVHCVVYSPDGEMYASGSHLRCRRPLCASDLSRTMRFICIFRPRAPGTALCQGTPHSLLIVSPSHAHPWGAQPGHLCGHSGRSPARSTLKSRATLRACSRSSSSTGAPRAGERRTPVCVRCQPG